MSSDFYSTLISTVGKVRSRKGGGQVSRNKPVPCPFCGKDPVVQQGWGIDYGKRKVVCVSADCTIPKTEHVGLVAEREAIKAWNKQWADGVIFSLAEQCVLMSKDWQIMKRENEKLRRKVAALRYKLNDELRDAAIYAEWAPTKIEFRSSAVSVFKHRWGDAKATLTRWLESERRIEGDGLRRFMEKQSLSRMFFKYKQIKNCFFCNGPSTVCVDVDGNTRTARLSCDNENCNPPLDDISDALAAEDKP